MAKRALLIQESQEDAGQLWTLSEGTSKVGEYPTFDTALAAAKLVAADVRALTSEAVDIVARDRIGANVMRKLRR